jgi:hypothetical protein
VRRRVVGLSFDLAQVRRFWLVEFQRGPGADRRNPASAHRLALSDLDAGQRLLVAELEGTAVPRGG